MDAMTRTRGSVHPAWGVLAIIFAVMLATAGVRAAPSVLLTPLQHSFGWSAATVSGAVSVNIALLGLTGPFAAALIQSLGIRRTILGALALLGAAAVASGFISTRAELYLTWGVMVGLGSGTTGLALAAIIANRWFERRRGLAIGLLTASNASGQLVFLPLLASLVSAGSWRSVSFVVGGVIAALIPAVYLLLPEKPADRGVFAYGAAAPVAIVRRPNPVRTAFAGLARGAHAPDFWLLFASFFICGFSTNGLIGTHLISYCMDMGIPEVRAASLLALMGVFDLLGTTASGWLTDRYNPRVLLFFYYGLRGLSLIALPMTDFGPAALGVFAIFYGLDWIATIPPTVTLANTLFGRTDAPVIFAWIVCGHQLGAAVAALGAGAIRAGTGSYLLAFTISGGACLLASLIVLRVGHAPADPKALAA